MTTRRQILGSIPATGAAFASGGALFGERPAHAQEAPAPLAGHFHPKGKAPSSHTIRVLARDFEEQARGLIAERADPRITADAGNVAFDFSEYAFLGVEGDFDSIHPSMTRIARLNNNFGLYEVIPGIYQVRGFDLSDMTFVRGQNGWIVFDPITFAETSRTALGTVPGTRG